MLISFLAPQKEVLERSRKETLFFSRKFCFLRKSRKTRFNRVRSIWAFLWPEKKNLVFLDFREKQEIRGFPKIGISFLAPKVRKMGDLVVNRDEETCLSFLPRIGKKEEKKEERGKKEEKKEERGKKEKKEERRRRKEEGGKKRGKRGKRGKRKEERYLSRKKALIWS
jgi:hypothetical protein